MMLTGLISSVLARYGLQHAHRKNWLPKNHYQRKALECLKADDISGAIEHNTVARRKDPDYEEAMVVRELILMRLDTEIEKCAKDISGQSAKLDACRSELRILDRRRSRMTLAHTVAAGAAVLMPIIAQRFGNFTYTFPHPAFFALFAYCAGLFGGVYWYVHFILLDAEKSPVVRFRDRRETLEKKIAVLDKYMKRRKQDCAQLTDQRAQVTNAEHDPISPMESMSDAGEEANAS